jgi:hypothetical protein
MHDGEITIICLDICRACVDALTVYRLHKNGLLCVSQNWSFENRMWGSVERCGPHEDAPDPTMAGAPDAGAEP